MEATPVMEATPAMERQTSGEARARVVAQQVLASAEDQDPFAAPADAGVISVYGVSTSRVQKVLWAAAECGITDVRRHQKPPAKLAACSWYRELNSKGTVPTLRDGPLVLNESNTIVAYLCQKYGKDAGLELYPDASPMSLALAWQWMEYGETTLAQTTAPIFFNVVRGLPYPPAGQSVLPSPEQIQALVPACARAFAGLDKHLTGRAFVLGDAFTMADMTAGVQANRLLGNNGFGFPELAAAQFPAVHAWYQRLMTRPAFQQHVLPFLK